jgi:hypothetical protein
MRSAVSCKTTITSTVQNVSRTALSLAVMANHTSNRRVDFVGGRERYFVPAWLFTEPRQMMQIWTLFAIGLVLTLGVALMHG